MKPNDKAIEAARKVVIQRATHNSFNPSFLFGVIEAALDAAYAAQFQSEDYAGLVERLRKTSGMYQGNMEIATWLKNPDGPDAADAIEALLAERDTVRKELIDEIKRLDRERIAWKKQQEETAALLKQVETERDALKAANNELREENELVGKQMDKFADQIESLETERDALAARLAPVDDESRHLTAEEQKVFHSALRRSAKIKKPVEDEELVEIVAREIAFAQGDVESPNSEFMDENWHCWEPEARAAIAAIRPHIEAAERERCAKRILETNWVDADPEDIAAAIRSGK